MDYGTSKLALLDRPLGREAPILLDRDSRAKVQQTCPLSISTIYFKLAEITNGNELKNLQIWSENRQKVTKLSKQLQATNGLKSPRFLAK